jgi:hypothetical protein
METIKLPESAKVVKVASKTFKMKELKRQSKDELWTIYKENIGKKCPYIDVNHYCTVPLLIIKQGKEIVTQKWGINFKENDYVDLNLYENGKSFCSDIYIIK